MDSRAEAPGVPALTPSDGGLTAFAKTKKNLFDHETELEGPAKEEVLKFVGASQSGLTS